MISLITVPGRLASVLFDCAVLGFSLSDMAATVVMDKKESSCFKIAGVGVDYQITGPKEVVLERFGIEKGTKSEGMKRRLNVVLMVRGDSIDQR